MCDGLTQPNTLFQNLLEPLVHVVHARSRNIMSHLMHVFHHVLAAGFEVRNERHAVTDTLEVLQRQVNAHSAVTQQTLS
jgi:hypothetical protein